jgi:hypothetical protein
MTWGKRKDGQAYNKNKPKGMSGNKMETNPTSDVHLKTGGMERHRESEKGNRDNEKVTIASKISSKNQDVQLRGDMPPHSSKDNLNPNDYSGWILQVDGKVVKRSDDFREIEKEYEKYKTMSFKGTESVPTPSGTFLRYITKFPDTKIAQSVRKYGYENYIPEAGSFARALARGDLEEAFRRADPENEKILREIQNSHWINVAE